MNSLLNSQRQQLLFIWSKIMAAIKISDLQPVGSEFFMGEENFINELSDADLNGIHGGLTPLFFVAGAVGSAAVSYVVGKYF
ncbi:hypothetical protein [Microseira wollei]|nr:hypothetical protein [Microseira wollei]